MPDACNNEQQCCPPDSLGYKSCESGNLYSSSDTETFSCEGQPDVTLMGRGVSSVSQEDADAKAVADLELQLAIYRVTNPCESCPGSDLSQITDCGDQNWPAGPASGLPYTNTGDNVTGWTNIDGTDFTTDGSTIQNLGGGESVATDRVNAIVSNSFTMTGQLNVVWNGESDGNQTFQWFIIDTDNQRAVGFEWAPVDGLLRTLVWCDAAGDFGVNSEVNSQESALDRNINYEFTFTYDGGVLTLSIDDETITVNVGCSFFGYLALGSKNEIGTEDNVIALQNISVS